MQPKQKQLLDSNGVPAENHIDLEFLRSRVTASRARAIENLDKHLAEFESNFNKKGGEVWWIDVPQTFHQKLAESTTNVSEVHVSDGRLQEELGLSLSGENARNGSIIIEQGEFLIAETAQVIVHGDSMPFTGIKTRIVTISIERVVPLLKDAGELIALLTEYPTWQGGNSYSIISPAEESGYKLIVAVIDNGRHKYFESPGTRQMMRCIGCGACAIACPLVKVPDKRRAEPVPLYRIANAVSHRKELDAYKSTLCGACTAVCPVGIPIHQLFIDAREHIKPDALLDKQHWVVYRSAIMSRRLMNQSAGIKQFMLNRALKDHGAKDDWHFAKESFNEQWKKRR